MRHFTAFRQAARPAQPRKEAGIAGVPGLHVPGERPWPPAAWPGTPAMECLPCEVRWRGSTACWSCGGAGTPQGPLPYDPTRPRAK